MDGKLKRKIFDHPNFTVGALREFAETTGGLTEAQGDQLFSMIWVHLKYDRLAIHHVDEYVKFVTGKAIVVS